MDQLYHNPKTQLKYINKFTFLIAVVLSAQSTDLSVNKATKELFKIANAGLARQNSLNAQGENESIYLEANQDDLTMDMSFYYFL